MLASAIPTVIELAIANHPKSLFVHDTLNIQRNAATSTTVLSNAASVQLTSQVAGLKVPQPKSGMIVIAATNSHNTPDNGMPKMPTAAEIAFITTVISPARTLSLG